MDTSTMKPREVEAYLRESVRKIFGDVAENGASITSSHGYFSVDVSEGDRTFTFTHFRKKDASKIIKALRALKG